VRGRYHAGSMPLDLGPDTLGWGRLLLLLASVVSLLVLIGEGVIKTHHNGVDGYPGGRLAWLRPHLDESRRYTYANGIEHPLEAARHLYRARYGLAPNQLVYNHVETVGRQDWWVLDFESAEQLESFCRDHELELLLDNQDGTGLAAALDVVQP
jgi:hypothetical protein